MLPPILKLLRDRAEQLKMGHVQVAQRAGIAHPVVANLFTRPGTPRLSTLKRLSAALGMQFDPVAVLTAARQGRSVIWMAGAAGIDRQPIDRLLKGRDCCWSVAVKLAAVLG